MPLRVADPMNRVGEFGLLGLYLSSIIDDFGGCLPAFSSDDLTGNLSALHWATSELTLVNEFLPAAASLLLLEYPLQIDAAPGFAIKLARHSFDFSFLHTRRTFGHVDMAKPRAKRRLAIQVINNKDFRDKVFPTKSYGAAAVKANVRLGSLARAFTNENSAAALGQLLSLLEPGTSNDIVCSYILYATTLAEKIGHLGIQIAAAMVRQVDNAKGLSNALKALGLNASFPGCLLVEGASLQGRGCKPIDLTAELYKRTNPHGVAESVIPLTDGLKRAIDETIKSELDPGTLPDCEEWWSQRWLWCVNGSQNNLSDKALGIINKPQEGLSGQRYRRMAAEEVHDNPLYGWDGTTNVSYSEKLECGKNRAIFACDTASYFAFSWLLGAVQQQWKNSRILLDPGASGYSGLARRLLRGTSRGGVNLMLDYDDFNSHHDTETMKYVFLKTCERMGAPAWYTDKLVSSFDKMYILHNGRPLRILGTLMSGHRGTTYINSVLNAAYIRHALGSSYYDSILSLHTGDDVYMRLHTLGDCVNVLRKSKAAGCRMNPSKQSIGYYNAEFLRMGVNPQYGVGYICRAIPALVCGNWTNEDKGDPLAAMRSLISSTRGLLNRGAPRTVARLLSMCLGPFICVKRSIATQLLCGELAIEGSPAWSASEYIRTVKPLPVKNEERADVGRDWGRYATSAYLSKHLQPVEVRAIELSQVDPGKVMQLSSYNKGELKSDRDIVSKGTPLISSKVRVRRAHGVALVGDLVRRDTDRGALSGSPVLQLIKNRLTDDQLKDLLLFLGKDPGNEPIREYCFGESSRTKRIVGALPYSDAAALSKRTSSDTIMTSIPIHL
jgi:hypothetical protein